MSCKKRYSKVKFMTMAQMEEILKNDNFQGKNGRDYGIQIDEIKDHYYDLCTKKAQQNYDKMISDYNEAFEEGHIK